MFRPGHRGLHSIQFIASNQSALIPSQHLRHLIRIPLVFSAGWLPALGGSASVAHACKWQTAKTVPDSNTSMFNKMSICVTITDGHIYGAAVCVNVRVATNNKITLNHSPFHDAGISTPKYCQRWRCCLFSVTLNPLMNLYSVTKPALNGERNRNVRLFITILSACNFEVRHVWSFTSTSLFVSHK
jgi:hypothetical protein